MTDAELLELLKAEGDLLRLDDVSEMLDRGAPLAPGLTAILDDDALWKSHGAEGWSVIHAFFLLGGIRPPGALATLIRALGKAYENEVDDVADLAPVILSGFGPAALPELAAGAADRKLDIQVRLDLLIALGWTARRHPELAADGADRLRVFAESKGEKPELRRLAASVLLDFARPADRAFLTGGEFFEPGDVDAVFRDGPEPIPAADEWLSYYDPSEEDEEGPPEETEGGPDVDLEALAAQRDLLSPIDAGSEPTGPLKAEAKVGRNDPCPCGSGKKYKKCCGG